MSRINFDILTESRPDLRPAWVFLDAWIHAHPNVNAIALNRIAPAARSLPIGELAKALEVLRRHGLVQERFQVMDTDGTLLAEIYSRLEDVPSRVPSRFYDHYIDTRDTDVVPVFILQGEGDARE